MLITIFAAKSSEKTTGSQEEHVAEGSIVDEILKKLGNIIAEEKTAGQLPRYRSERAFRRCGQRTEQAL